MISHGVKVEWRAVQFYLVAFTIIYGFAFGKTVSVIRVTAGADDKCVE